MQQTIGQRVTIIRKKLGLKQTEFGESLGITNKTVSGYEKDKIAISKSVQIVLQLKYNVNINWLEEGKGKMFDTLPIQVKKNREIKAAIRLIERAIPFAEDLAYLDDEYIRNETASFLQEANDFLKRNK